jgi:hypothetical protein
LSGRRDLRCRIAVAAGGGHGQRAQVLDAGAFEQTIVFEERVRRCWKNAA